MNHPLDDVTNHLHALLAVKKISLPLAESATTAGKHLERLKPWILAPTPNGIAFAERAALPRGSFVIAVADASRVVVTALLPEVSARETLHAMARRALEVVPREALRPSLAAIMQTILDIGSDPGAQERVHHLIDGLIAVLSERDRDDLGEKTDLLGYERGQIVGLGKTGEKILLEHKLRANLKPCR